jgi:AAA domain
MQAEPNSRKPPFEKVRQIVNNAEEKPLPAYETISLIELAEEQDDPKLNLLGEGYLRRGMGMMIVGPSEVGKSSPSIQLSIEWGCHFQNPIIKSRRALRVIIVQSEDDRQDAREMARVYRKLGLSEEQINKVRRNTRFIRWRGSKGEDLIKLLDTEIERKGKADLVIVNPLSAYAEEGVMSQKFNRQFLYEAVDPFLDRHSLAIIFVHHTPKFRDDDRERSYYEQLYAGAGDATLTNWPRASLFIVPTGTPEVFRFQAGKRDGGSAGRTTSDFLNGRNKKAKFSGRKPLREKRLWRYAKQRKPLLAS